MSKCDYCEHVEMCGWRKSLEDRGCDFFDDGNKWIPVKERLPEERVAVLVWCPTYRNIYCAYRLKEQWWIFGAFSQIIPNEVTAWMSLPEPYKADKENKE